jgi:hypothetical protein
LASYEHLVSLIHNYYLLFDILDLSSSLDILGIFLWKKKQRIKL